MQPFSFFFVGYSLWGVFWVGFGLQSLTVLLGSGQVGSDDLGYGPGSGFSFEPVQTSILVSGTRQMDGWWVVGCVCWFPLLQTQTAAPLPAALPATAKNLPSATD